MMSQTNEKITLVEYELIEDVNDLIKTHPDVQTPTSAIQAKLDSIKGGALVEITKQIGSHIKILDVKEVDESLVETEIW